MRGDKAAQVFGAVDEIDGGRHAGTEQEAQGGQLQPSRHREPHHHIAGPVERERQQRETDNHRQCVCFGLRLTPSLCTL